MPYINVQITEGATRSQKEAIVREITDILVRVLGKKPEETHVVIQEIAEENWGFAGMLTDAYRKQSSGGAEDGDPSGSGGREQPKSDRRKRGDLQKRGLNRS